MLKNLNPILSPDLIKVLMEMGHGDEIVIADGNYPSASNAKNLIRLDGLGCVSVLEGILSVLPLDKSSKYSVSYMNVAEGDKIPEIWTDYKNVFQNSQEENTNIEYLERFEFYERGKNAYAIIATSETALFANIILKKGVVEV
ncbi:fucose isomerase [Erysipelothrix inopinata]|uniref:Fucose isomerase n=1 Tax=Erysipelothrix inopinata TaxID=225084 RepID=A0A7G9RZR3_9FIRM|nr:RbsD/FucU domain-containing protein [Erysipelothrix inopinata]QNN61088.1 fucose isomerase [Erysipelothrix inopinata]